MAGHTRFVASAERKSRVKPAPASQAGEAVRCDKSSAAGIDVRHETPQRSLPDYRVEPPDQLSIEMLKLVPRAPYRIAVYDTLQIRAMGTVPGQPIDAYFLVEAGGIVTLGPMYGRVRVAGMTIEEATDAIHKQLYLVLAHPEVSVQLSRTAGTPAVTGDYLVGPDGTINLKEYGTLFVAGKTVVEIQRAMENHLKQYFDSPEVGVEVRQFNSKVFYVITEGTGAGDNIRRIPWTGNDTVLDALGAVNGLSEVSSKEIWVARPTADPGKGTILRVDYAGITRRGETATNYQLLPGDRVFIAEDKAVAFNARLKKTTDPLERVLGLIVLGTEGMRSLTSR
jgi:polysaccharide export outer membrane protein